MNLGPKDGVGRDHHVELLDIIAPLEVFTIIALSLDIVVDGKQCIVFRLFLWLVGAR